MGAKKQKKVCYIAGPMRGYKDHNIPWFRKTAAKLRRLGFVVVSPVEIGDDWADGQQGKYPPEEYLRRDIEKLVFCNSIALHPKWRRSVGATCEAAVARTLGFEFYDEDGKPRRRPSKISIDRGYEP